MVLLIDVPPKGRLRSNEGCLFLPGFQMRLSLKLEKIEKNEPICNAIFTILTFFLRKKDTHNTNSQRHTQNMQAHTKQILSKKKKKTGSVFAKIT